MTQVVSLMDPEAPSSSDDLNPAHHSVVKVLVSAILLYQVSRQLHKFGTEMYVRFNLTKFSCSQSAGIQKR